MFIFTQPTNTDRGSLESTQEELTGTKHHATRMLKQQGTEIADCSTAIGELTDHMTSVLANLNKRAGKHVVSNNKWINLGCL